VILDAHALYAFFVRDSPQHWAVAGELELVGSFEELLVSPFVVAELEVMVRERVGADGWLLALEQLGGGAWTIAPVDAPHLAAMHRHVAAGATLAEASVAVLAEGAS
jgi:predicted nucleic acid-binding protein